VLLWHGFLSTSQEWRKVMPALAEAGYAVLVPDMRGYGDSDKPEGTTGYDARALAEEFRTLVHQLGFGGGKPMILAAHDMGAPPALLWAADHPEEIAGLLYIEAPVMLSGVLSKIIAYTPEAMKEGSMWWWILPLAPDVPERLVVGREREFLTWFYDRHMARREAIADADVDETLRTFAGREGVLGAMGLYRAAFTSIEQTRAIGGVANRTQSHSPCHGAGRRKGLERERANDGQAGGQGCGRRPHHRLRTLSARGTPRRGRAPRPSLKREDF
jgi:pimeloyl-ACP methyl ester carboxylesterase